MVSEVIIKRPMTPEEGEQLFQQMLAQISVYQPDEIIAVSRSGFSLAQWVSQELALPLGAYWPKDNILVHDNNSRKLVFVDDNVVSGETYLEAKQRFQKEKFEFRWAVLFSDKWKTSQSIQEEIIQGTVLDYFATGSIWGSRKVSKGHGIRFRDE